MKLRAIVAGCAGAVAIAGAARAEDLTVADLKCVVVFGYLASTPQYKDSAGYGVFYYLGRAEGREPGLDVKAALKHLRDGLPLGQYADEAKRCGAALKERNDYLKNVSDGAKAGRRGVG